MNTDDVLRIAAASTAVALLLAPYWRQVAAASHRAVEAAIQRAGTLARVAAAALLIAAAWGKVPLPRWPQAAVAPVSVETPSVEMQALVAPIAEAMRNVSPVDRALWAETWTKAATVVAGDAVTVEVAFTDTRSLRAFTALALDIAWRRIGRHQPGGNESLRTALEAAYGQAIGATVIPVTPDLRARYVEFAKAVAWAGVGKG